MTRPTFGMQFRRDFAEPVPVIGADFSRVLVIETSGDADADIYPLNEPVRISTGNREKMAALGTGLLADAVKAIHDQLDGLNAGADVTVVRVAEGGGSGNAKRAATAANIVAVINDLAGIPAKVNATPRIVVAGRTAWKPDDNTTNPVIAALEANLGNILAVAPVDVDDQTAQKAVDQREDMASERIIPIGVAAKVWDGTEVMTRPMAPRIAGLMVRIDNAHGGLPFHPVANRPVFGLAGLSRAIPFSLLDGSTEGQRLLEANVSIVVQGETGVDGAVGDGGFTFIGTDNAATGELWEQIHQVRGTDYIITELIAITRQFIGNDLLTAENVEAWINSIAFALRDHKADGRILGYTPANEMFRAGDNSPEDIRLGHLNVDIGIEPAPVFKLATHDIRRYRPAVTGLVRDIIASLNAAA